MIKAVFRDFDGTIGDTLDLIIEAANQLAKRYHRKDIPNKGTFRTQSMRTIIQSMWIHRRQVPFFVRKVRTYMQLHQKGIQTFPGIQEVRNTLSQNYITWIITSNKISTVKAFIHNNEFIENSEVYNCGMWNKARKIKKMMKKYQLKNDEVIYIGDEVRDIHSCKKLWIKIIAVIRWYDNEQLLEENKPDSIVHTPKEIPQAIKQLEK